MIKMNRFFSAGILLTVVIVAGAVAFRSLGHLSTHTAKHAAKTIYYCPMHPNYTSDRPGTCPICNMTLVKREAASSTTMSGMAMPAQAGQAAAPKVFTVAQLVAMKPGEICLLHKCKMGTCMIAMTPEFARLGKCPHCGEDLGVIIKDAFPQGYASLQLGAGKQQTIGVKTAPILRAPK